MQGGHLYFSYSELLLTFIENSDEFEGNYEKAYLHDVVDGKYS